MRGGDSTGLRAYNERLIISAIRRRGKLSKAEIARETGLSGQAASVIVNALLDDRTLRKQEKVRGGVGQPYTPIDLNPEGAYALGVKIGRRSTEAILVNFRGEVVASRETAYATPLVDTVAPLAEAHAGELVATLRPGDVARIAGVGVAAPSALDEWSAELGLAPGALDDWRHVDIAARLERALGQPTTLYNDANAACAAELALGGGIPGGSALYLYLGTFVGGGLVIGGRLHFGDQMNAGAIGSMPMACSGPDGRPRQLIHLASIIQLERALDAAGLDGQAIIAGREAPVAEAEAVFAKWAETAAEGLARAIVAAASVVDIERAVVDGLLRPEWRAALLAALDAAMERFNRAGLAPIELVAGSIGTKARVLGAALLPLHTRFSPDTELLAPSARQAPEAGQ